MGQNQQAIVDAARGDGPARFLRPPGISVSPDDTTAVVLLDTNNGGSDPYPLEAHCYRDKIAASGDGRTGTWIDAPSAIADRLPDVRISDLNWMQVDEYLGRDDRIVLPIGSTEQHGYLSLATDLILAERVSVEAAAPLGVPVLPVLPFGVAPGFVTYPGTVSFEPDTLFLVLRDALDSLYAQGFRRFLVVNGHGGNAGVEPRLTEWAHAHETARVRFHSWYAGARAQRAAESTYANPTHANWFENFPWTRLAGVAMPAEAKPMAAIDEMTDDPADVRRTLGDGTFGGAYERPDDEMLAIWSVAVEEVRDLIDHGWD